MKKTTQTLYHSLIGIIGAGVIFLLAPGASAQNLFVSDYQTGDIYEYSPSGSMTTFATGLSNPAGLAFNSAGDLFASDQGRGNVYEFINNNGILSSTPTLFASGFNTPAGLAFDNAGNLFIANAGGNDIIKITPGNVRSTFASGLNAPLGLAINGAGTLLFVGNSGNGVITQITSTGSESPFATGLNGPGLGLAINQAGDLFVSDVDGYNPSGEAITEISPGGGGNAFCFRVWPPERNSF